jgi:hypothetical protein
MADFHLDREMVDDFVAGRLGPGAEEVLAEQVARVMPFHWSLPHPGAARLSRITRHLGGEPALLAWLDRHPGLPRLTARSYAVIAVLDHLSARSAVVTALGEFRARNPDPPGLADYLPPRTDHETLASLSYAIEALLGDDRADDAVRLADAAAALVRSVSPRAAELDPDVGDLVAELEQARRAIRAVRGQVRGTGGVTVTEHEALTWPEVVTNVRASLDIARDAVSDARVWLSSDWQTPVLPNPATIDEARRDVEEILTEVQKMVVKAKVRLVESV